MDAVRVVPYDPQWPRRFTELGAQLRDAIGDVALRIDHIGSTAVPELAAKPVIDVQISVATLEPVDPFVVPLQQLGFVYRADNTDRTKRYLRAHHQEAAAYEQLKQRLAAEVPRDRAAYTEAKVPFTWELIHRAGDWAQATGWEPGPSDA